MVSEKDSDKEVNREEKKATKYSTAQKTRAEQQALHFILVYNAPQTSQQVLQTSLCSMYLIPAKANCLHKVGTVTSA